MQTPTQQTTAIVSLSKKRFVACQSFAEASLICQQFIKSNNLGGTDWSKCKGGFIYHPTKGIIAQVSYNGRVWESNGSFKLVSPEIIDTNKPIL